MPGLPTDLPQRAQRVLRSIRQSIPSGVILGRKSSGEGPAEFIPIDEATQALLDDVSATHGSILYRGSAGWAALPPGTQGYFLQTDGAASDPFWAEVQTLFETTFGEFIVAQSDFEGPNLSTDFDGMDGSRYNHDVTLAYGSPKITTSAFVFGASSLDYSSTDDDSIRFAAKGKEFQILNKAFFIEFWIDKNNQTTRTHVAIGNTLTSDEMFEIDSSSGGGAGMDFRASTNGTSTAIVLSTGTVVGAGSFKHVLWVRDGSGNFSVFVDGTRRATTTYTSTLFASVGDLMIGAKANGGAASNGARGKMDGFRFGIGTTGGYDPTATSITVPTAYHEEVEFTADMLRDGKFHTFYSAPTAIEDIATALQDTSTVQWTYDAVNDQISADVTLPREILTAARTYFVATTGNDSNDGLTSGTPFLTIQKALNVCKSLDFNGFKVTISVANGTYTGGSVIPLMVGQALVDDLEIQGNTGTPSSVLINSSAICFEYAAQARAKINGFKLQSTQAFNGAIQMNEPSASGVAQNIEFGACSGYHMGVAAPGCLLTVVGGYTISGGAKRHFSCQALGKISHTGTSTVTLTGTPNFSNAFAQCLQMGHLLVHSGQITYSGAATGKRYDVIQNSHIETFTGGATYFPGNAAGTFATGGQYT